MKPDELEVIADRISDDQAIDWDRILTDSAPSERPLLAQLQTLASIAHLHRSTPPIEDQAHRTSDEPRPPRASIGRWGHLELLEPLGHGTYGEVYRAWDPRLDRQVALKVLRAHPGAVDRRVIHEARLLAKIHHPNVPTIYGGRMVDGRVGLWSELIEGHTLNALVEYLGPLGAEEAAHVGIAVCGALSAAHAHGLLHRDIKAQNVMRARGGRIVLMDFGAGGEVAPADGERGRSFAGTPVYLAPEVLANRRTSIRSDIYGLGVLLYYLVTGHFPIEGDSLPAVRDAHACQRRIALQVLRPDLPKSFVRVVECACALDPDARFATAAELQGALEEASGFRDRAATPSRGSDRPWIGVFIALLVLAALVLLAWWMVVLYT